MVSLLSFGVEAVRFDGQQCMTEPLGDLHGPPHRQILVEVKTIGGDTLLHTAVDHRRAVDYRNHAVIGIGVTAADVECHHITIGDAA